MYSWKIERNENQTRALKAHMAHRTHTQTHIDTQSAESKQKKSGRMEGGRFEINRSTSELAEK